MKVHRIVVTFGLPILMLQACASGPPAREVTAQMARTEAVLQQADRSGVAVNSLPELQGAKDKYAEAKREAAKNTPEGDHKAVQLAKQAEVDAQYATAKAQSTTQESAAREVQSGVEALKDQASTNAAGTAATP
jgi:hypothetical protein